MVALSSPPPAFCAKPGAAVARATIATPANRNLRIFGPLLSCSPAVSKRVLAQGIRAPDVSRRLWRHVRELAAARLEVVFSKRGLRRLVGEAPEALERAFHNGGVDGELDC